MRLRITETAFAELTSIAAHIAKDNPSAASAVVGRIEEVLVRIKRFPHLAHAIDISGIRIFPARPFPYLVFYTLAADEIVVRNIRHGARSRPGR